MKSFATTAALSVSLLTMWSACSRQHASEDDTAVVRTQMVAFRPEQRALNEERIDAQLRAPAGFRINVFADNLGHARMLEVDPDSGAVYLTCPKDGEVKMLRDDDGDGVADHVKTVLSRFEGVHGIALHEGVVYLATPETVWAADQNEDGSLGDLRTFVENLPDGGQHPNRTLAVGPDERLYITIGSSCNACDESNPEHATIVTVNLEGKDRKTFARGLRNTLGFGWHPVTGVMWGMDHGSDGRGNDIPPEELNELKQGADYGWPYVYAKGEVDPIMDDPRGPKMTKAEYARKTEPATLVYQAHSAPIGMAFYNAQQFPAKYRNGAFVAMRGSWNRFPPTGYKVAFIRFDDAGRPKGFEDFVTGFLSADNRFHFGRLAGVAIAKDGSLLFTDDTNGVIYRVSYDRGKPAQ